MLNYSMQYLIKLMQKAYKMVSPEEGKTVLKNVAVLSALQTVTYILPMLILPYLFRIIGPERFGLIAFAQAFNQYFIILTDYGFSVSATKKISLYREDPKHISEIVSSVMTLKILFGLMSALLLLMIITTIPKFQHDTLVYLLSFGTVLGSVLFPMWYFQGTEQMKYIAKINILGELVLATGIFYYVRTPDDYIMVPAITSAVAIATGIFGQFILVSKFGVTFRLPSLSSLKLQLREGWDIFISVVAINAYTNTRVFAVGLLTNNTLTGFYSVAERIANAVQTFPLSSFAQAIFPRMSKIYQKNKETAFELMKQIQLITVIIAAIFLPIVFLSAPAIINIFCDGDYSQAVMSLRFLLLAVLFVSANAFRVQYLLVCGKTNSYSRIHVRMAMVGLPLIIFCIYHYSYVGAAMATTLIEAGILTATSITVNRINR